MVSIYNGLSISILRPPFRISRRVDDSLTMSLETAIAGLTAFDILNNATFYSVTPNGTCPLKHMPIGLLG
jgi:hypothetical protein